jgi:hypothetical protein
LKEATAINSVAKLKIRNEEITSRFEKFGGSARFLFNAVAETKVDEAFQAGVVVLLDPNWENTVQSSALVHIIVDDNFAIVGRKWASHAIAVRAVDALIDLRQAGKQVWLEATKGKLVSTL